MGICSGICNVKLIAPNSDLIVQKDTITEPNQKISPYSINPLFSKVIYLQKKIKNYLHFKKPELYKNMKNKDNGISNNEVLNTEWSKQERTIPNEENNKKHKNEKKLIKYDDESTQELLVPTMKITLLENNIFNEDAFTKNIRHKKNTKNDPRDVPFDGKRRVFPKIMEEQSSYT